MTYVVAIDPEKSCRGKVQYFHKNFAIAAAKEMEQRRGKPLYKYKCTLCGFYHITKSKQKGRYEAVAVVDMDQTTNKSMTKHKGDV